MKYKVEIKLRIQTEIGLSFLSRNPFDVWSDVSCCVTAHTELAIVRIAIAIFQISVASLVGLHRFIEIK